MKQLFCDCKTDKEKCNFFLSGRAVETGVIAPAISNDVAMAYHRCAEFKKECEALRAKIEAAENDAAHQKALAESALRVAEGWERKCGELRAKITEMEQQEPVEPEITIEMEHAFYEKVTVTRVGSIVGLADGIKAAMLAAAPEAKP